MAPQTWSIVILKNNYEDGNRISYTKESTTTTSSSSTSSSSTSSSSTSSSSTSSSSTSSSSTPNPTPYGYYIDGTGQREESKYANRQSAIDAAKEYINNSLVEATWYIVILKNKNEYGDRISYTKESTTTSSSSTKTPKPSKPSNNNTNAGGTILPTGPSGTVTNPSTVVSSTTTTKPTVTVSKTPIPSGTVSMIPNGNPSLKL